MILSDQERRRIRSQVACSLSNLGTFRVYWSPRHRRILCRSVQVTRHFRVPDGALEVGIYRSGVSSQDILDDLLELVAGLPEPEEVLVAPADECEEAAPACVAGEGCTIKAEAMPPRRPHPWRSL